MTIGELAKKLGCDRASISLAIHERRNYPKLTARIRKELDLEELAA